jgi:two-component system OmpR family sensor kinase
MSLPGGTGRAWERLRTLPDRTPLRVKLITAVLALVAIALAVISFTGIAVLRSYLLNQSDSQLQSMHAAAVDHQFGGSPFRGLYTPEPYVVEAVTSKGILPADASPALGPAGPSVPTNSAWLLANAGKPVTVPALSGNKMWRVIAYPDTQFVYGNGIPGQEQQISGTLVVGLDVTNVYKTIDQLTSLDLIVSALLLLALLIIGFAVVRASLKPLTDIEATAEGIAAGDLTRRVPDRDPRTEVGRLGRSLNTMLAQIETAFDAQAASEIAARGSEERMRQFVADASHELRTPLTAIRGYAEYYRQRGGVAEIPGGPSRPALGNGTEPNADAAGHGEHEAPGNGPDEDLVRAGPLTPEDLDRIMQRVEQESARMGVLVEDMLLLARLDQQRPLEQRTVDMLTLAADAVHDARVVAPDRHIGLTVGAGAALLVVGDEVRLRQVIGNLMSNALNHTPDGTPIEVRVRSGTLDEWRRAAASSGRAALAAAGAAGQPLPAVIVEVEDRGPGLTPYQAEHVFERFYRADQARTRKAGGAGLGLAIVAALVTAHGGNVWVQSPPGGGATFHVALPLAPEAQHIEPDPDDNAGPDMLDSHGALAATRTRPPQPGTASGGAGQRSWARTSWTKLAP